MKNTQYQASTRQLRDFPDYAANNGLQFNLFVRPTTRLSGPLVEAIEPGAITLRQIP